MEWECQYCHKRLTLKSKYTKSGHLAKCATWHKWKKTNFTYNTLYNLYITNEMSLPELQQHFKLTSVTPIWKALKKYNIPRRSIKKANSSSKTRRKIEQTNLKKYGAKHNFCRDSSSRTKWEKRLLEEEGIVNVFQRKEVIEKIRQTIAERYPDEDPRSFLIRGPKVYSTIHRQIVEFLTAENIDLRIEKKITNQKLGKTYHFDIITFDNKLIEINGDYWHGNPKIYKPTDIILKGSSREYYVKDKWEQDRIKIGHARSLGYDVLVVWEKDIKDNINIVKQTILNFIHGERNANSQNQKHQKTPEEKR